MQEGPAPTAVSLSKSASESKLTVAFSIGMADAVYTVCSECGERARAEGLRGIPTVASDSRLSIPKRSKVRVLVSPCGSLSDVLAVS